MLRFLVTGAFVVGLLYAGVILAFPYYQYVMMQGVVEEAADVGVAQLKARRKGPWRDDVVCRSILRVLYAVRCCRVIGITETESRRYVSSLS